MRTRYDTPSSGGAVTGVHWKTGWAPTVLPPFIGKMSCGGSGSIMVASAHAWVSTMPASVWTYAHTWSGPSGITPVRSTASVTEVLRLTVFQSSTSADVMTCVTGPVRKLNGGLMTRASSPRVALVTTARTRKSVRPVPL